MSAAPRCAAFTIVRDEPFFLPLWHAYYSQAFAAEDLYVLHHVTAEDEVAADGAFADALARFADGRVVRVVEETFDPVWLRRIVCEHIGALLAMPEYSAVCFTEVDEILHVDDEAAPASRPSPAGEALAAYVAAFAAGGEQPVAIRCVGWELHHDMARGEAPLDPSKPLMAQRGSWHRNVKYDKALITRAPLRWSLGFHACEEPTPQDEALLLVHLHKYDFAAYLRRHEARAAYKHAESSIENGWNAHYRTTGPALMAQYMSTPAPIEPMPDKVRSALLLAGL